MTCPNCIQAEARADWPGYTASCRTCMARGIAHGPDFWKSGKDGSLTASYKAGLRLIWGDEWLTVGHEAVKAAAAALKKGAAA